MPLKSVGAIALLLTSAGYAPSAVASNCSTMLEAKSGDAPQGTVTPEKLLALRDIGSRYPARGRDLFSISPDMRFVAFQLHQADPGQNAYCVALVVVEDRKSTRLKLQSLMRISYAVFCLKKK